MLPSACYIISNNLSRYNVSYAPANFEVAASDSFEEDAFSRNYIILLLPRSHGTLPCILYTASNIEIATANGPGGDAFTQKYFI